MTLALCAAMLPARGARSRKDAKNDIEQSYVDLPLEDLQHTVSELHDLEPESDQSKLPDLLEKVGVNVSIFFKTFPNVSSVEHVREEKLKRDDSVEASATQLFEYLAIPEPGEGGLKEYRTDSKGRPAKPTPLEGHGMLTSGFTRFPVLFDTYFQYQSRYRYIGTENRQGQETEVVAFAQLPDKAFPLGTANGRDHVVPIFLQGIAWIDPQTHQIVAMRTDLLHPMVGVQLERMTTMISFEAIQFKKLQGALFLPHSVEVSVYWYGQWFRNTHTYSDYRLFSVQAK